jgi:hypothetical protein
MSRGRAAGRTVDRDGAAPSYKTPGATAKVKMEQLCAADFATSQKPVANWQRNEALERYGVRPEQFSGELDHLVPVALGGSNDPDNLWPFRGNGAFTFSAKQALGLKLPRHGLLGQDVAERRPGRVPQGLDEGVSAARHGAQRRGFPVITVAKGPAPVPALACFRPWRLVACPR